MTTADFLNLYFRIRQTCAPVTAPLPLRGLASAELRALRSRAEYVVTEVKWLPPTQSSLFPTSRKVAPSLLGQTDSSRGERPRGLQQMMYLGLVRMEPKEVALLPYLNILMCTDWFRC